MKFDRQNLLTYVLFLIVGAASSSSVLALYSRVQPAPIYITPLPPTAVPEPTVTPGPIVVFVNGAVNSPGLYPLHAGSRVDDAIEAAGGFSDVALVTVVNLAQVLEDGSQVYVPSLMEETAVATPDVVTVPVVNMTAAEEGAAPGGKVNINTASKAELETLPGIGPSTAQKIVDYREDNGLFVQIEDIMNVSGIGEGKFDTIREQIVVEDG